MMTMIAMMVMMLTMMVMQIMTNMMSMTSMMIVMMMLIMMLDEDGVFDAAVPVTAGYYFHEQYDYHDGDDIGDGNADD